MANTSTRFANWTSSSRAQNHYKEKDRDSTAKCRVVGIFVLPSDHANIWAFYWRLVLRWVRMKIVNSNHNRETPSASTVQFIMVIGSSWHLYKCVVERGGDLRLFICFVTYLHLKNLNIQWNKKSKPSLPNEPHFCY